MSIARRSRAALPQPNRDTAALKRPKLSQSFSRRFYSVCYRLTSLSNNQRFNIAKVVVIPVYAVSVADYASLFVSFKAIQKRILAMPFYKLGEGVRLYFRQEAFFAFLAALLACAQSPLRLSCAYSRTCPCRGMRPNCKP